MSLKITDCCPDGRTVAADVADVAVAAPTEDGHTGRTYAHSGARSLSFGAAVAEIAEVTGRPLRFVPVTGDEYRAEVVATGHPETVTDEWIALSRHILEERGAP
ncbi:hypothetical protein [Streptomyces sp. NPDC093260]|uniref:hypothetical protein n=1 Tax=Streptomyces sp. NPDC093260 TaxID=3155073 RepID=UPI00341FC591